MPIQTFYVPSSSPYKGYSQTFTSSSTWTCPVGVTDLEVFAVGGGGGGGSVHFSNSASFAVSGGGGGGQVVKRNIPVVPNTTYNIIVGAGGSGGTNTFTGQMGSYSAFNPSYTLLNGHLQQPTSYSNYYRYNGGNSSYNDVANASVPYNDSSWNQTTVNTSYNSSTSNVKLNSAVANQDPTRSIYLGSGSYVQGTYFWVPVKPSTQYTASGYFGYDNSTQTAQGAIRILWFSGLYGTNVSNTNGVSTNFTKTWTRISNTATSPSNATYALVYYQFTDNGSGNTAYLSGPQFEEGSLTSYKSAGFNTVAGAKVIQNLGYILEGSSSVIAGGGGGGGSYTNQGSSWFNSATPVRPEYSGTGGGASVTFSNSPAIGGYGASYNGRSGNRPVLHVTNYTATSTEIASSPSRVVFEGLSPGAAGYYRNGSVGEFQLEASMIEPGYDGIYGTGAPGGKYSVSGNTDVSASGLGQEGRAALANTGNGGSGVAVSGQSTYLVSSQGGIGGSGIVILKWLGQ